MNPDFEPAPQEDNAAASRDRVANEEQAAAQHERWQARRSQQADA